MPLCYKQQGAGNLEVMNIGTEFVHLDMNRFFVLYNFSDNNWLSANRLAMDAAARFPPTTASCLNSGWNSRAQHSINCVEPRT